MDLPPIQILIPEKIISAFISVGPYFDLKIIGSDIEFKDIVKNKGWFKSINLICLENEIKAIAKNATQDQMRVFNYDNYLILPTCITSTTSFLFVCLFV